MLAVNVGFDKQGAYRGLSANAAATLPVRHGDEIAGQVQFVHYDGGTKFPSIREQNDYLMEAGYYLGRAKLQPFVKYESQNFARAADAGMNIERFGAGANYYIHGQNLKWTLQYLRAMLPDTAALRSSNELTIQFQLTYW